MHDGPQTATTLVAHFPTSRQAIVKHLRVLADAGLVAPERDGREVLYRLADPDVIVACEQMARVMRRRLARIADLSARLDGAVTDAAPSTGSAREPAAPLPRSR